VSVVFFLQALDRRTEAGDRLADSLLLGRVNAPALEGLGDSDKWSISALAKCEVRGVTWAERRTREDHFKTRSSDISKTVIDMAAFLLESLDNRREVFGGFLRRFAARLRHLITDVILNRARGVRNLLTLGRRVKSGDSTALLELGDALLEQGNTMQALHVYEEAGQQGIVEGYVRMGHTYEKDGQFERARRAYEFARVSGYDGAEKLIEDLSLPK